MKAEYIQQGNNWDYTNATEETIKAGTIIIIGQVCTVAGCDIAPGETGTVVTDGVWSMPKSAAEIKAGTAVYYDEESDCASATKSDSVIGIAITDAPTEAAVVMVRLNG